MATRFTYVCDVCDSEHEARQDTRSPLYRVVIERNRDVVSVHGNASRSAELDVCETCMPVFASWTEAADKMRTLK